MFAVQWKFKNDHIWEKSFDSVELRDSFINTVGLVSHPDIVKITLLENDSSIKDIVIKNVNCSRDSSTYDNMNRSNQDYMGPTDIQSLTKTNNIETLYT